MDKRAFAGFELRRDCLPQAVAGTYCTPSHLGCLTPLERAILRTQILPLEQSIMHSFEHLNNYASSELAITCLSGSYGVELPKSQSSERRNLCREQILNARRELFLFSSHTARTCAHSTCNYTPQNNNKNITLVNMSLWIRWQVSARAEREVDTVEGNCDGNNITIFGQEHLTVMAPIVRPRSTDRTHIPRESHR